MVLGSYIALEIQADELHIQKWVIRLAYLLPVNTKYSLSLL
jgi:hypothetical protein